MKKPLFIIGILSCIVVALLVTRIGLVNSISTTGIKLVNIQKEIADLKDQHELLEVQYLQAASYTNLDKKAIKLGYVPVTSEVDLSAPMPLALR